MTALGTALLAVGLSMLAVFLAKLHAARRSVLKLRAAGLPMPDFSLLTGHLLILKTFKEAFPINTVMHNVFWEISKQFPSGIFYIDLWPFARTTLVITTPSAALQVDSLDLGVPDDIVPPIEGITGGPSLLTMSIGPKWKGRRQTLNPAFSNTSMTSLAPAVVEQVAIFRDLLLETCASGSAKVFQLEEMTLKLTFDVIGVVTLGTRMGFQTRDNELAKAMRMQIEWTSFTVLNPLQRYLSLRHLVLWFNGWRIDRLITKEIDKRLQQDSKTQQSTSIVDMLLADLGPNAGAEGRTRQIKTTMIPQIRAFLFGGHDTTSSTLLYCYYLLAEHPQVLDKVLEEHTEVFGSDTALTQDLIHQDPFLLNKLPYTTAVMKEVLRLFPPAASMRIGRPGANITDDDGNIYPMEGCNVWTLTLAIHHNPKYWPEPEAFKPERWLVEQGHELYPVKGAWRPFHHGPKNCLGQPLAMLELKICLVMTLRDFCITPAYHQWDSMHFKARVKSRIRTVNGHRAYQAEKGGGGAHPADGFPVQVTLRKT